MYRLAFVGIAASLGLTVPAMAVPVLINGGFEDQAFAPNTLTEITKTGTLGWTGNDIAGATHEYIINGNIQDTYDRYFGTTPFGNQYLGLNAIYRSGFRSIESQSVSGFVIGNDYALTVHFANLDGASDARISVVASDGVDGGGDILGQNLFAAPVEGPYGDGVIDFISGTLKFTAVSDSVTFSLGNQSFAGVMAIDAVSLSSLGAGAVPEPAAWTMMIAGFGLVGGLMRRRVATATIAV